MCLGGYICNIIVITHIYIQYVYIYIYYICCICMINIYDTYKYIIDIQSISLWNSCFKLPPLVGYLII